MIRQLAVSAVAVLALCACSSRQMPTATSGAASQGTAASASASTSNAVAQPDTSGGPASASIRSAADSPLALPASSQWQPGVNYDVVSPAQPTNAPPGKVQVMEVFWLACPHCYTLEPYIRAWRKTMPSYVQFVRVPVMWGPVQQAHARLFYTLEVLGRNDLIGKTFQYIHVLETRTGSESILVGSSPGNTLRIQEAFAEKNGVSPAAFASAYDSFDVNTRLQQAEQIQQIYQVDSTPTIIVDGRYKTNPDMAGGEQQLIELIDFLTKWDHDHVQRS
jgi:thiol:disulfide interchange protein DsbA